MQQAKLLLVLTLAAASCAEVVDDGLNVDNTEDGGEAASGGAAGSGGKGGSFSGSGGGGSGGKSGSGGTSAAGGASDGGGTGGAQTGGAGGAGGTSGAGGSSGGTGGTSTGGASGSGTGGGSSGGAGGSGGSGTGGTGGAPATGFVAQYKVEIPGASGTAIGSQIWIVNNGSTAVNLSELKLRYYFTNEVTATLIQNINWANIGPIGGATTGIPGGEVTITSVAMPAPVTSANTYLEFGFTGSRTLPAGQRVQFSWTVQNHQSQNFVQTGDYSYNAGLTSGTGTDWQNIVLFQGQSALWGVQP